jgi:hypothetical protein
MTAEQLNLFDPPKKRTRVVRRGVAPTSRLALSEITESGRRFTIRSQVFECVKCNPGITRAGIVDLTQIRLQSVTGRVTELITDKVLIERGTMVDGISGMPVKRLFIADCAPVVDAR